MPRYGWQNHVHEAPDHVRKLHKTAKWEQPLEFTRQMLQSSKHQKKPELSSLMGNLWSFQNRASGDARDKIYSLKHISQDTIADQLQVDYSANVEHVFAEVARTIICNTKSLHILGACQMKRNIGNLPSWVPDWTVGRDSRPLRPLTELVDWQKSGCHQAMPLVEAIVLPSRRGNELSLRGYRIRTVLTVSTSRPDPWKPLIDTDPDVMIDFLVDVASILSRPPIVQSKNSTLPTNSTPMDNADARALCRQLLTQSMILWSRELSEGSATLFEPAQVDTVTAESHPVLWQTLTSLEDRAWQWIGRPRPSTLLSSNTVALAALALIFPTLLFDKQDHSSLWTTLIVGKDTSQTLITVDDPQSNVLGFFAGILPSLFGRKFFVSAEGADFGMCPYETQVDDVICLFPGATVPYVLRRIHGSDLWTLVGECYCHSYMDGKKGNTLWDGDRDLEVFNIV